MIRILMVDPDPSVLEVSKVFLEENEGIKVDTITSVIKALDQLQGVRYDAVITELEMPEMDGISFLREVRARGHMLPLIFFSGNSDEESLINALNEGGSYFLRKGDDPVLQFPELTESVFRLHEQQQNLREIIENQQRFMDLSDDLPQPVFEMDSEGNLTFANKIALEKFGYSIEDFDKGLDIIHMVIPEDRSRAKESIWWNLREISLGDNEYTALRKDGSTFPIVVYAKPIIRDGFPRGLRGIVIDIAKRRAAERAHKESEERLNLAIESADLYVWDWYLETGEVVYTMRRISPAGELTPELEGEVGSWEQLIHPDDLPRMMKIAESYLDGKIPSFDPEIRLKYSDNKWCWVEMRGKVMGRDDDGRPVKMTGIYQDITEKVMKERILRGREAQFRTLFTRMNCGGCIYKATDGGKSFVLTDINYAGEVIEGRKKAMVVGKTLGELYSCPSGDDLDRAMSKVWKTGKPRSLPPMLFEMKGKTQWREYYIYTLPSEEIIAMFNDISERIYAQRQILNSLKIKETLIKEIHHRVKNNLQVIASILKLQSLRTTDDMVLDVLRDCRNRVFSIAMIHEELYRSDDLAHIRIADYIKKLGDHLIYEFLAISPEVSLVVDCEDDITLDIDTGIPCGLIIDELVTNSLKYAFQQRGRGMIRIDFRRNGDDEYILAVSDNGVGFPESIDIRATESLGMQLVTSLVDQLGGTLDLHRGEGTEFVIQFSTTAS